MFFQQAVLREFLRLIDSSLLSRFIDIKDQSRNRYLALVGSYTSEIDTLDLSAASDSVSLQLVKGIFPPSWLIPMLVTRSSKVILPDGTEKSILKFAPMGSALCFPTQCIIFASVCIYAACLYTYEKMPRTVSFSSWLTPGCIKRVIRSFAKTPSYYKDAFQPLAVYGDDICVDQKISNSVTSILSRLGFQVNLEKSFRGGQGFRESCGGYYLCGSDITPLYFRVKGVRQKLTAERVASQVHTINEAWNRGYKTLYRFLRQDLMCRDLPPRLRSRSGSVSIPYILPTSTEFGIYSSDPKNNHLGHRDNIDYQREEIRVWTISYDWRLDPLADEVQYIDAYEYMRWWAGHSSHSSSESKISGTVVDPKIGKVYGRSDRGGARLSWRWIPRY